MSIDSMFSLPLFEGTRGEVDGDPDGPAQVLQGKSRDFDFLFVSGEGGERITREGVKGENA